MGRVYVPLQGQGLAMRRNDSFKNGKQARREDHPECLSTIH